MRNMQTCLLLAAVLFVTPPALTPAFAQNADAAFPALASAPATVPRLVQFSGVAKDANGKPLTGTIGITFLLYSEEQGGAPLWMETQNVQADVKGHYSVELGATKPDGLPTDEFTSGEARWLGVQIAGQEEQPRVLLLAVPYALKAADASTIGGLPPSAFVRVNPGGGAAPSGNDSLTTGNASSGTSAFDSSSRNGVSSLANKTVVTPGGKTNFLPIWTGTNTIGNSIVSQPSAGTLNVNGNIVGAGDVALPQTTGGLAGVIDINGLPFLHACCSASAQNTFAGTNAGNLTITGGGNTAVGYEALIADTNGGGNTAVGWEALVANNSGSQNTALGFDALHANNQGVWNTAVGTNALFRTTTGQDNTAVGVNTLVSVSTGSGNTAVGQGTGGVVTTGSDNSFIGWGAFTQSNPTNATAIGAQADVEESNAMVLGSISGVNGATASTKVGIGTTAPFSTLDIVAPNQVGLFVRGPASGVGAGMHFQTTGSGLQEWEILDTGASSAQGADKLNIRNINTGNDIFTILANGSVGIETTHPDNTLTVNGSADKPGGGSWGTFSDRRLKTLDGNFSSGLSEILKINPIRYRYKEDNAMGIRDTDEHVGLVAQEVQQIIPEAVTKNKNGYLLVNNDPIIWAMLNAIKQQQDLIRKQQRQIASLASQVKIMQTSHRASGEELHVRTGMVQRGLTQ